MRTATQPWSSKTYSPTDPPAHNTWKTPTPRSYASPQRTSCRKPASSMTTHRSLLGTTPWTVWRSWIGFIEASWRNLITWRGWTLWEGGSGCGRGWTRRCLGFWSWTVMAGLASTWLVAWCLCCGQCYTGCSDVAVTIFIRPSCVTETNTYFFLFLLCSSEDWSFWNRLILNRTCPCFRRLNRYSSFIVITIYSVALYVIFSLFTWLFIIFKICFFW